MVARVERAGIEARMAAARVPPHNLEAEESVLGACLISRDAIGNVIEVVAPGDFYKPAHGEIMNAILDLYGRGEPVDAITLAEELRRRQMLDRIGGMPYLHTLVSSVPTAGSAAHYARIVEENALLRRMIEAAQTIEETAFAIPEDVEDAVDRAENLIYQVSQRRLSTDFEPLRDLLTANMELVEKLYERGSSITGVPTGFVELDKITAGFQASNLIVVAARPSMGKSSLSLNIAQHVSINEQIPVVIFSLEMSKMELVQRLMCGEAHVDANRLRRGALQDSDWPKISHALGKLAEAPIFIDDTAHLTIMEMRAKCRRLKSKHGLGMVIVDYLQLMEPPRKTENRVQEVSEISRSLKILAREIEVPVIAVSQLSRNVEYRADKRPLLADLRDCVTGDTLVQLGDGRRVPIRTLVGRSPEVVSVSAGSKVVTSLAEKVWCVGVRPIVKVRLASGRSIRATRNHRLLTMDGWRKIGELAIGTRLAIARVVPEPTDPDVWPDSAVALLGQLIGDGSFLDNAPLRYTTSSEDNSKLVEESARQFGCRVTRYPGRGRWHQLLIAGNGNRWHPAGVRAWLRELGIFGQRSYEKRIPEAALRLSNRQIGLLLRHLWATDGHISLRITSSGPAPVIYYATSSSLLASDVASLLLRLGIVARIRRVAQGRHRDMYNVHVGSGDNARLFVDQVGAFGSRTVGLLRVVEYLESHPSKAHLDTVPPAVWDRVHALAESQGTSVRRVAVELGVPVHSQSVSRTALARLAAFFDYQELARLAHSDLFWDRVVAIENDGEEEVYDLTVPETSSWLADGIVSHNSGSIEQDSDVVIFIYRDEVYNQDTRDKGIAEIHVAKHRNGPIGKIELTFLEHYTKFANLARGV